MAQDTQKDFFISYNKADCEWAEWIAWQLEEVGYTTIVQAWDFRPGGNFVLEMDGAIKQAERIIAVLSPDYLGPEARYSALEWAAALQGGRLLPVRVRECDVKGLLGSITWINLVGLEEQAAHEKLLADVRRGRAKPRVAPSFPSRGLLAGGERPAFPVTVPAGQQGHVPFMVEDLPEDFVQRPAEFEELIGKLLNEERERPVAITAALRGAGGYGKTTMARAVCHDERVRRAFRDGILWVTLGENVTIEKLVGKVEDLIYTLSHERPGFTGLEGATTRLVELLVTRELLLVIDDVWEGMHLKPFVQGGMRCARLVTTRDDGVLPAQAQQIAVDAMMQGEAVQLLGAGLDGALRMGHGEQPQGPPPSPTVHDEQHGRPRPPATVQGSSMGDPDQRQSAMVQESSMGGPDHRRPQGSPPLIPAAPASTRYGGHVSHIPASEGDGLRSLAMRLGEWPLLLKLANGVLRERVNKYGQSLPNALVYINKALNKRGLTAFDAKNAQDRSQAVAKTLAVSFELLSRDEYAHYKELAVFPEDVDIPLVTLEKLWGATGGLDDFDTEALCARLHGLSLLLNCELTTRMIRLHDVMCAYLRSEVGREGLAVLDGQLLDAYGQKRWADVAQGEPYVWEHLAEHLVGAGRGEELVATVKDLRYLASKIHIRRTYAAEADLNAAEQQAPTNVALRLLKRNVANMGHLLNRCETLQEIEMVLHSRLCHLKELAEMCQGLEGEMSRPFLTSWYALPDLPHPALVRTLYGHTGAVKSCAISVAGDVIISASEDQTLKVWDARTGEECLTLRGHTDAVTGCAISAAGDFIVSASKDRTLKVWDAHTGAECLSLRGHKKGVSSCAISPAGDFIVSASADGTLKVWDARTGQKHLTFSRHKSSVVACAVSLKGNSVISADFDTGLKVWDIHTGKERLAVYGMKVEFGATGCAVSPAGDYLVLALWNNIVKVWDGHTGQERFILRGHKDGVSGCAVSPTGGYIVSASWDQTLKVWDGYTGRMRFTLRGHTDSIHGCAVAENYIVSASEDRTLKIWDIQVTKVRQAVRGHLKPVWSCAMSPKGDYIVSTSVDGTLRMWDAKTGKALQIMHGHKEPVWSCAVSPAGDYIVSASADNTLKVWDAVTRTECYTLSGHTSRVNGCAVSPKGDYIVSASDDKTLKVWDAHSGEVRLTLHGHTDGLTGCAVSPAGDFIVSASVDNTLKVWDAYSGEVRLTLKGHTNAVLGCAVSPAGDYIVSASWDKTLKVWDIRKRTECLTLCGHIAHVVRCAVSPRGDYIVSVSGDGMLKVWNAYTGACLTTLFVEAGLSTCAFHPDGEHIVAGGDFGLYFLRWVR